jgi:hypothetical protein
MANGWVIRVRVGDVEKVYLVAVEGKDEALRLVTNGLDGAQILTADEVTSMYLKLQGLREGQVMTELATLAPREKPSG